uniref:Uncharacterized protein n=1 Tax=Oryza rufipogon TaxID=4529 RepID=A0A0E0PZC3_ORYRU
MRDAGRAVGAGRRGRVRMPTRVREAGGGATATARGLPLIITIAFIEMGSSPTIATATVPTPTTAIRAKSPTPEEMGGRRGPPTRGWDAALPSCKDREIWSSQLSLAFNRWPDVRIRASDLPLMPKYQPHRCLASQELFYFAWYVFHTLLMKLNC